MDFIQMFCINSLYNICKQIINVKKKNQYQYVLLLQIVKVLSSTDVSQCLAGD
jgi:hypothetical protein